MEKEKKSLNESIIAIRVKLQETSLQKSGKNRFAGFEYFELADFLPTLNKLMLEEGINDCFYIDGTFAILTLIKGEEKQMYKKLWEHFNYIANLTMVIEEKMMDPKQITDLTIGEMHVLETVEKFNGQPMTKIANALKVTVGSLTIGVNRLIAKDYLIRVRDEKDHRVVNLSVTPKAKKVLKLHDKFHEDILLGVLDGVTIRDATKVMAQFNRVLENYINPKERTYASSSKVSTK